MKKIIILSAIGLAFGLMGCQKESHMETTRKITAPAISIITSLEDGSVLVSLGGYVYDMKMTESSNTGSVTSPELIANNMGLSFTTDTQEYESTLYDAYFHNAQGYAGNNSSLRLNNADFQAIYLYDSYYNQYGYYYTLENAGKYTYQINEYAPWITLASYNIGDEYKVNTFQVNTFFSGTTTTSYPSGEGMATYETKDIMYRFIVNIEKNEAVFVIYNAKFSGSPMEPVKSAIIVEGLKVDFSSDGISIYGTDLIPDVVEGNSTTPNENYIFNSISFHTTNKLYTSGVIDYQVAGRFSGHFTGSYLNSYYMK